MSELQYVIHPQSVEHIRQGLAELCPQGVRKTQKEVAEHLGLLVEVPETFETGQENLVTKAKARNQFMMDLVKFCIHEGIVEGYDITAGAGGGIGLAGEKQEKKDSEVDEDRLLQILHDRLPAGTPTTTYLAFETLVSKYGGPKGGKDLPGKLRKLFNPNKDGIGSWGEYLLGKSGRTPVVQRKPASKG